MKKWIMTTPSFLLASVAALPVLTCPACWPLYAGLLSSMGVGFIDYTPYLLPITVVLLFLSLFPLIWKAETRQGYKPLILGAASAILILGAKFYLQNSYAFYIGVVMLIGASVWNIWPQKLKCEFYSQD